MQWRHAAHTRELQRHDELHVMDVIRLNTEHASKVQIQLREIESLKNGHAAKIEAIRSDFVASWQEFCLQMAEEEETFNSEMWWSSLSKI
jgi:hypothetical protein